MMTTFEKVVLLSPCLLVQAQAPLQILINSLQMSRAIMPRLQKQELTEKYIGQVMNSNRGRFVK